jgi:RNA polymerase sigma factor (TIGR02999 family)
LGGDAATHVAGGSLRPSTRQQVAALNTKLDLGPEYFGCRTDMLNTMTDLTEILKDLGHGDPRAAAVLLPLVYDELRRLAAQRLAHEPPGQTLQATALVHEAYMRVVGNTAGTQWDGRRHFFAAAAEAMRRILVDNARRKKSTKHGGGRRRHDAAVIQPAAPAPVEDLVALDEALDKLAAVAPLKAELVKLRYFAGMTIAEAAGALGISPATAKRYWTYARTWLYHEVHGVGNPE